uniref:Uncharacterized protein n=1 Tax=Medicago truncatula TaxID=3880 RepID=Q1RU72_MEDTR|nr:hypothetical protein MtrDRAFT_AC153123g1v2 [Medicago truncatula]
MATNSASSQIRSEVHIPQRDGMTSSPSPVGTPREEPVQIIPLQERPLQGPPRPTETPKDVTPTSALVSNLLRTVQRQTSLIEEQNRRLMDLERARPLVRTKRTPSPTPSIRERSPRHLRFRFPRHSISVSKPYQEVDQKEVTQTISSKTIPSKEIPTKTQQIK